MKTKHNVQKTVLRTGAVIVSLVLISFTVAAQGFWKTILANSSFNQIAMAMAETPENNRVGILETENNASIYFVEQDFDAELKIEDWMKNVKFFGTEFYLETAPEDNLELENWMMNEALFSGLENAESPLVLESWMTNENVWNN